MVRPSVNLELFETRDFQRHLRRLARRGGSGSPELAHRQAVEALVLWARKQDPQLPLTHHGETRVSHTVKYDLAGSHRLVCYEHAGQRIPLVVGTHDEVDRWLNANAGREFTVNRSSRRVRFTPAAADEAATSAAVGGVEASSCARGPVLARLPDVLLPALGLSPETVSSINRRVTFEQIMGGGSSADEGIRARLLGLKFPSERHRNVVIQVIALLAGGQDDEAAERVQLFAGGAATASQDPGGFAAAVGGSENSDFLVSLSGLSSEDIERRVGGDGLAEWMLFLHPEQRRLVERDYNGPARLIGVSGSGKTSVLVHRANALAKKYPDERVLVLTLNPTLAQLLSHLLDRLCGRSVRPQIEVQTIYEYCYRAVKTIAPDRLIERRDEKSGEDLAICWSDFLEKPHASDSVLPVINVLESREDPVNAAAYLLDELVWIRSGFGRSGRGAYAVCERPGRGIQLPKMEIGSSTGPAKSVGGFPPDTRPRILRLLADYEDYMREGGLLDEDGVSLEAFSVKDQIRSHRDLRARCVLVDEVQDCSTVELAVIASIPTEASNGLFLTGDPVQKVYAKQHDLRRAGIDISGRGAVLKTNYRNTRQVLEAAFTILQKFRDLSPVLPAEILEPDYAFRDGPRPRLYECDNSEQQVRLVMSHLARLGPEQLDAVCVCSPAEATLDAVAEELGRRGLPAYRVRGSSRRDAAVEPGVKLALMQDVKGYEFGHVFLIDLIDRFLLPEGMPYEERWRPAFQVYVAMTRARDELTMSFVFNRSILLAPLGDMIEEDLACKVLTVPAPSTA